MEELKNIENSYNEFVEQADEFIRRIKELKVEEYQMMVKTIISTYKENGKVELTDYLIECVEKCLEDSYKYTDLCN